MQKASSSKQRPIELSGVNGNARVYLERCSTQFSRLGFTKLGLFRLTSARFPEDINYNLDFVGEAGTIIASAYYTVKRRRIGSMLPVPFVSLTGRVQRGFTLQTLFESGERLVTSNLAQPIGSKDWQSVTSALGLEGILEEHRRRKNQACKRGNARVVIVNSMEEYFSFPKKFPTKANA